MSKTKPGNAHSPVFVIGMPRSGSTIFFERFIVNENLGWLSNYSEMFPSMPAINILCRLFDNGIIGMRGKKKQYGKVRLGNRYFPQSDEAYNFWDYYARKDFSRDYLAGITATGAEVERVRQAVSKTIRYQGKKQFSCKITGPGRVTYLNSIFPDARFIHLVRDGRAVVNSLMKVSFWKEKGGFDAPFWNNGLDTESLKYWQENRHPAILAAIQWAAVIDNIRAEAAMLEPGRYQEVRYEDFVQDSDAVVQGLYAFAGLQMEPGNISSSAKSAAKLVDMNKTRIKGADDKVQTIVDKVMSATLKESGYEI